MILIDHNYYTVNFQKLYYISVFIVLFYINLI